jgi:transposase
VGQSQVAQEVVIPPELIVQNIDHLGIVSGLIDEIGVVEYINQKLGTDPREKVSAGVIVKAMLLNGLGFVSAPLYLFEQFFTGIATEHLLGTGVKPEHLNDDRLGQVMDRLYEQGLSELFLGISLQAVHKFGVRIRSAHLDSTSFHVHGAYDEDPAASESPSTNPEPQAIEITYGYSRDHRADLKQFVMNLICGGDGDIPLWLEMASGNQSDKAKFAQILQTFQQQWTFEGLCVSDAALYSQDNLQAMQGLKWLTRVPLTLTQAQHCIEEATAFDPSKLKGYRIAQSRSDYGGVPQRWLIVESEKRRTCDLEQLDTQLENAQQQAQQKLKKLSVQEFACAADALMAAQKLSEELPWHDLGDRTAQAKYHYKRRGKPASGDAPSRVSYCVSATLQLNAAKVSTHRQRAGRFILATNVLDLSQLSADDALQEYKNQQGTERGFRFLKDPLFFASSVFLKTPERIAALGMMMALCLLVYNLGQRQLRNALAEAAQTIPNQLEKPTQTPTLRWVFQCFMAVHVVVLSGVKQIVNLTPERKHILKFFSAFCRDYYLLHEPDP